MQRMSQPRQPDGDTSEIRIPPAPAASSPSARRVMQANRSQDTRPEKAIRSALHRRGLRFRKHAAPLSGLRCRADLVFPTEQIAVFIDGCFWHGCPDHSTQPRTNRKYWTAKIERNMQRDQLNDETLRLAGWESLRIWEHERPIDAVERIERVVKARRERDNSSPGS